MKRHLLLAMVVLVLIISVISCELLLEKPGKPTIHALFVSLDYYDFDNTLSELPATLVDAKETMIALDTLAQKFSMDMEISVLFDGRNDRSWDPSDEYRIPNKANIEAKIRSYATNPEVGDNDIFLLFYSGHGDENGYSLIVMGPNLKPAGQVQDSDVVTSQNLVDWMSGIKANKILILDTCFSGYIVPEYPKTFDDRAESSLQQYDPAAFYLTASSATQTSQEALFSSIGHSHGYFSVYFLKALGWNHSEEYSSNIIIDDIEYIVDGKLFSASDSPAYKNGNILIGDVFRYITDAFRFTEGWISSQTPQTGDGPLDLVLFSEQW